MPNSNIARRSARHDGAPLYDRQRCVGFILARSNAAFDAFDHDEVRRGPTLRPRITSAASNHRAQFMSLQLDLFDAVDPRVGLKIKASRRCSCGHDLFHVGPGRGAHRASLQCTRCGRHCGWLSHQTASFLSDVIERFGRPTHLVCMP
jgi:hypothetical protein